jgi:hypothetical protein
MPWFRRPTDPRLWLTYVTGGDTLAGWETFLIQYRDLLTALVRSGVAYVGLERDARVRPNFDRVIGRHSRKARPRDPAAFLDYCQMRQQIEAEDWIHLSVADIARFRDQLRAQFAAARYDALYRRWLLDGDAVLSEVTGLDTPADCALEPHCLPHPYFRGSCPEPLPASHAG